MLFTELGDRRNPAVLLIHGHKETNMQANRQIKTLLKDYHVIIPEPGRREEEAENAAKDICDYVEKHCGGKLYALCGLSDGWEIARELLGHYHVESCKVIMETEDEEPGKIIARLIR